MRMLVFAILLILSGQTLRSQQVSDVRFEQSGKQVVVSYDLTGDISSSFAVSLYYCISDGPWLGPVKSVSGHVGSGQKAGIGKQMIWNVLDEQQQLVGEVRVKVQAEEIITSNIITISKIQPDEISKKVQTEYIIESKAADSSGIFSDSRDGKTYRWVKIGTQIWMAENLAYLPAVNWSNAGSDSKKHYYVYGYYGTNVTEAKQSVNYKTYGVLYDWRAAQEACPPGWHLSSDEEWKILERYQVMSESDAKSIGWRNSGAVGGKLKEVGTIHWNSPNKTSFYSSGFEALPGGYLRYNRGFLSLRSYAYFWSASDIDQSYAWGRLLRYYREGVYRGNWNSRVGLSVRCLQN